MSRISELLEIADIATKVNVKFTIFQHNFQTSSMVEDAPLSNSILIERMFLYQVPF